ncbi:hypothetical protein PHLCEN_2v10939 [Hermanssonia centrifuga]|uniref:Uncharacterized protein n=1 Tax=Hermanssonia centrifuga TaxID=98765 RepID=A0A2R6NLF6_9APHY|nr:hypothetical protein PHLCEN_2v10939 [Hermanssonia centrifuga]
MNGVYGVKISVVETKIWTNDSRAKLVVHRGPAEGSRANGRREGPANVKLEGEKVATGF